MASNFKIGPDDIQVGLDTFGNSPRRRFSLQQYPTIQQIRAAVDNIIYVGSGTNTAAALDHMTKNSFSKVSGARDGVPRVGVIITDGSSWDNAATQIHAQRAKNAGITLMAVRVGSNVDVAQLLNIASDPAFVFPANVNQVVTAVKSLVQNKPCNGKLS